MERQIPHTPGSDRNSRKAWKSQRLDKRDGEGVNRGSFPLKSEKKEKQQGIEKDWKALLHSPRAVRKSLPCICKTIENH